MGRAEDEGDEEDETLLSDDSSFYGDDNLRSELEERAENFDTSHYWANHHLQLSVIAHTAIEKMAASASQPQEAFNLYERNPNGRQLSENVDDFLKRLPPLSTSTKDHGSWIYCANPYAPKTYENEDQPTLVRKGRQLLEEFTALKAGIEANMAGKNKSVITRQLAPHRKQLARSLLTLARETNCTSGKWMLFPSPPDVNAAWSLIAHATVAGELGFAAKVATDDGSERARLICIYTQDYSDREDVKRVLERVVALGLCGGGGGGGEGKAIWYKADVYTYLDLMGGNEYELKTSLFSSRDILRRGSNGSS